MINNDSTTSSTANVKPARVRPKEKKIVIRRPELRTAAARRAGVENFHPVDKIYTHVTRKYEHTNVEERPRKSEYE